MKKTGWYLLYGCVIVFAVFLIHSNLTANNQSTISKKESDIKTEIQTEKSADKIQVFLFHSTNRCYSCITMGQYAKDTIDEFFQLELKDGKIEFKEINVDLPANKEVASKFKAAGTSLFINAIIDGKDNIQEEVQAWRLLGNKQAFSDYLSKKIRSLIGETVSIQAQKEIEKTNITFYSGDNCPSCERIEKYFEDNNVKDKVAFEEKNVSENQADSEQMAEDAMQCDIDPESFGVPFLWADGKCYLGEKDIINFFKQKLS